MEATLAETPSQEDHRAADPFSFGLRIGIFLAIGGAWSLFHGLASLARPDTLATPYLPWLLAVFPLPLMLGAIGVTVSALVRMVAGVALVAGHRLGWWLGVADAAFSIGVAFLLVTGGAFPYHAIAPAIILGLLLSAPVRRSYAVRLPRIGR